jgi:cell wall-associated NlpC family hydrolase
MSREKIVEAAKSWLNTPFHHEARIKNAGVDCLQLLIGVFQETGYLPLDLEVEHYSHEEHLHDGAEKYLKALEDHGLVMVDEPQAGDVVMFRIGRRFSHAAIVVDYPLCIHSYIRQGVSYVNVLHDAELARRARIFYSLFKDNNK